MIAAEELKGLLKEELAQREQEGCRITADLRSRIARAPKGVAALERLYDRLMGLSPAASQEAAEPSDLAGIRKLRPRGPRLKSPRSARRLGDRLRGAMLGRCAGCLLGKPVEGWTRARIEQALRRDGCFPLRDYFRVSTIRADGRPLNPAEPGWCTRGHFHCMERDDDIDYTILGVHYLKRYGRRFTTANVAHEWLERLPYHMVYTAERAAYRNLVAAMPLDRVPTYRNPYREWIGAQIRADGFGYCAAGLPRLAAEFAWRDAALSHVKNGIYGEMMFAAMIAAAAVCDDLDEVIRIGLSEIPAASRLARAVHEVLDWTATHRDWRDTFEAIQGAFGHYHWVHTINNAAVVIMALCHGKMDFTRTIGLAVMGGWDTDCNGATAGSVLGAMLGADRLPGRWVRPLKNRLRSFVIGYDNAAITDIADEALAINRRLAK